MNMRSLYSGLLILPLLSASPAFAMKGIDAARTCSARPNCTLILDNSGGDVIVIVVDGTTIVCDTPQSECQVWTRVGGTRQPHIDVDGLFADPARGGGTSKPGLGVVAPKDGPAVLTR